MNNYDSFPTFWSNEFYSRKRIRSTLDEIERTGEYSMLFDQFGPDRQMHQRTPINERAIRMMLSPWLLDMQQLTARKAAKYDFPKPRITIYGEINTAGNLCVFWAPTHYGSDLVTDFTMQPSEGSNAWGSRPNRELMFFRSVEDPLRHLNRGKSDAPVEANLPGLYLKEIAHEFEILAKRLDWHFDITWDIHVTIRQTELSDGNRFISEAYIETTEEKAERELAEQKADVYARIEGFEETYGFALDHYFDIRESVPTETLIGGPMTDMGRNRHVSKILRAEGHDVDGRTVKSIESLLDELQAVSPAD